MFWYLAAVTDSSKKMYLNNRLREMAHQTLIFCGIMALQNNFLYSTSSYFCEFTYPNMKTGFITKQCYIEEIIVLCLSKPVTINQTSVFNFLLKDVWGLLSITIFNIGFVNVRLPDILLMQPVSRNNFVT